MAFSELLKEHKPKEPSQLIRLFDDYIFNNQINSEDLDIAANKFNKLAASKGYINQPELVQWLEQQEMNILLDIGAGDYTNAEVTLSEMYALLTPYDTLSIHNSEAWLRSNMESRAAALKSKKSKKQIFRWSFLTLIILWVSIASFLDSDAMVIARADASVIDLADRAGMSDKAKAIFVRTDPQFVDAATIKAICSDSGIISEFAEMGCYTSSDNRIYIRDLPSELDAGEIVTAAHEMLHAAANTEGIDSIDSALMSQHMQLTADEKYKDAIAPYASLDAATLRYEQQAILGTEVAELSPELEQYYSNYFVDSRASVIAHNESLNQIIDTKIAALDAEVKDIEQLSSNAEIYYSNHSYAAATGNRANYNYYWAKYTETYDLYTAAVTKYNSDLGAYRQLIAAYSGTELAPLETKTFE